VTSGLLAAIFVTGALYLVGTGTNSRRDNRRVEVPSYGYRYPDRREDGLFQQMERIISSLSLESLQGVISNIKHEILGSLSTARDDEVQRVDEDAQSSIGNGITDTLELLGGGSQVEDCLLQALCYLTPEEEKSEAGESRKNKEKQKLREKKKKEKMEKKKQKKAKNNKNKNKDTDDDYEDENIEDDYDEDVNNEEESIKEIEEEDCDVFQCDIVRYGYQAFQLYDKVQKLREQFDSLSSE